MAQPEEEMTVQQVAAYLNTSVSFLYKLRCLGRGPLSYKNGKYLAYRKSDVDAWAYRRRVASMRGGAL